MSLNRFGAFSSLPHTETRNPHKALYRVHGSVRIEQLFSLDIQAESEQEAVAQAQLLMAYRASDVKGLVAYDLESGEEEIAEIKVDSLGETLQGAVKPVVKEASNTEVTETTVELDDLLGF